MEEIVKRILGWSGLMISGSKSGYMQRNPDNLVIFNSNVIAELDKPTKVWYGDIDLTQSIDKLKELASELGTIVYVLREMDARFENEENPLVHRFVVKVNPEGITKLGELDQDYYSQETLKKL